MAHVESGDQGGLPRCHQGGGSPCVLRIVVKLAVIKDIPAISLLGFVLQFSFFRERKLPLGSEMPNERCHPGSILGLLHCSARV